MLCASRAHAQLLFARDVKLDGFSFYSLTGIFLVVFSISLAFLTSEEASVATNMR